MLQINLPPEMRCDQIDAREREHWVSALADPDMKRKETNDHFFDLKSGEYANQSSV